MAAAQESSSEHTDAFSRPIAPKLKEPENFKRYSTHYWTCKVCVRDSLQHLYLMTPRLAEQHERNAYHLFKTSQSMYQLKQFSPEPNLAWDGPNPETDLFAWLREKEFREYNERKAAEWEKENPDWNAYDPAKDEYLHPDLDSGWRNTKGKGRGRGRGAKNSATTFTPRRQQQQQQQQQQKKKKEEDDVDTAKVIRKGMNLGYYAYDPLPKPLKDVSGWTKTLTNASKRKVDLAPEIDWDEKFATDFDKVEDSLISPQVSKTLFDFGTDRTRKFRMSPREEEEMFLFLELPTSEKIRRIEILAMRISNPSQWSKVVDETQYWT